MTAKAMRRSKSSGHAPDMKVQMISDRNAQGQGSQKDYAVIFY
jgi:hypothetical protein